MTNIEAQDYSGWIGQSVVDQAGDKVGKVSEIFVDDESGQPEWLTINTGLFSSRASFVPLQGASAEGDKLVIPFDKAKVKDAPQVDEDGDGHLEPSEEEELYRYYGRSYGGAAETTSQTTTTTPPVATTTTGEREDISGQPGVVGHDTSGPTTDDAMTRSEEEVRVGVARREAGRARLRKYIVTEQVTQTVPVSREEVHIEREPITEANRDAAYSGKDLSEEEHEVVLHEEVPVAQKEVVAKERVRLATDTVTSEQTVTEDVRKERIVEEGVSQPGTGQTVDSDVQTGTERPLT